MVVDMTLKVTLLSS